MAIENKLILDINMKTTTLALLLILVLSGCSDGVPDVIDLHHPQDFDGNQMVPTAWVKKFCFDKPADNVKCLAVKRTITMDAGRGVMPKGY